MIVVQTYVLKIESSCHPLPSFSQSASGVGGLALFLNALISTGWLRASITIPRVLGCERISNLRCGEQTDACIKSEEQRTFLMTEGAWGTLPTTGGFPQSRTCRELIIRRRRHYFSKMEILG